MCNLPGIEYTTNARRGRFLVSESTHQLKSSPRRMWLGRSHDKFRPSIWQKPAKSITVSIHTYRGKQPQIGHDVPSRKARC
jgi:hypothetical protein